MILRPHQELLFQKCSVILKDKHLCYLAAEERVGKTLVALALAAEFTKGKVLILTKKKALRGWEETISACPFLGEKDIELLNYEAFRKCEDSYSFVILDEAHHGVGAYPRVSKTAMKAQEAAYGADNTLLLSATPHAESFSQLFHQFNVSRHSPFDKYKNFYEFFRDYGIPEFQWIGGNQIRKYNKIKEEEILKIINPYFVRMSRVEAGFEIDPRDKLHYIELTGEQKTAYEAISKNCVYVDPEHGWEYNADSAVKKLLALHQIEGGSLKFDKRGWHIKVFENNAKVEYIKKHFGDTSDVAIFYNYVAEGEILHKSFQNAQIFQGTSYAEGIDLSHVESLIIYSQNFSASKYIQRRARQCNYERKNAIEVHFLIVKGCISEMVYKCVAEKNLNFTAKIFSGLESKY